MLSAGTRIGPYHVDHWIKEGSCGQSYKAEGRSGEEKGKVNYLKLFYRDLSEKEGFSEYFSQECRAIQQIEGRGIWPLRSNGKMKWKHWLAYNWFEGKTLVLKGDSEDKGEKVFRLRSMSDWMEFLPEQVGPDELKSIMIDIHCGLNLAHAAGVIHGNLKPSNVLIKQEEDEGFVAWITEFALFKIFSFQSLNNAHPNSQKFLSQSTQYQESMKESQRYRPDGTRLDDIAEEQWDLYALGGLVKYVIEKSTKPKTDWAEWLVWAEKSLQGAFLTIPQSMEAIPGVNDLSDFGMSREDTSGVGDLSDDEVRRKREIEWEIDQRMASAKFRRNITGLIGCLFLSAFVLARLYLFFNPSPWVEYSIDGASDKYQLGFGIWSGKAWGILPSSYDPGGKGGQDVAGEWVREDGVFRLKFRKFKKINEQESGKKLWQFIGKGSTSEEDYYIWSDYLNYNQQHNSLEFIKRADEREVFLPGKRGDEKVHLFPEIRIRRSGGLIKKAELIFKQTKEDGPSWSVFIGLGFLLASLMYHRVILNISVLDKMSGKD